MSQLFKEQKPEEQNDFDAGFKLPNTKSIQQKIAFGQHQAQMEEEEKAEKAGQPRKKRQKPKKTCICFCGNPSCTIGEFVETQGE